MAALAMLAAWACGPALCSTAEEGLAQATLKQVEWICKKTRTLEQLGKATLSESVTMIDLGPAALPALLRTARDPKKDWRVRYWAADMVSYVAKDGPSKAAAVPGLLRVAGNEGELTLVRMRALAGLEELSKEDAKVREQVRAGLRKTLKSVRGKEVRNKIGRMLARPDGKS